MPDYRPRDLPPDFVPDKDDRDYAEAFTDFATLLQSFSAQPSIRKKIALRLSTCRNAYLAINSLFVDLQNILGHGRQPSHLSSALEHLRRGEQQESIEFLDRVSMILNEMRSKLDVWDSRSSIDVTIREYLASLRPLQRDRMSAVINKVRTRDNDNDTDWDQKYYELSDIEPARSKEWLDEIRDVSRIATAIVSVSRSIAKFPKQDELFGQELHDSWEVLLTALRESSQTLELDLRSDGSGISWLDSVGAEVFVPKAYPGMDSARAATMKVIAHASGMERKIYDRLAHRFRPNVGIRPLPEPYVVDLTEKIPRGDLEGVVFPTLETVDAHGERSAAPKIAIVDFGIPLEWYQLETMRYREDSKRDLVSERVSQCIRAAAESGAISLVCPEYFLPRNRLQDLSELAKSLGIILVSGVEGTVTVAPLPHLVDEAIIAIPGRSKNFSQIKYRPSVYEPAFGAADGSHQYLFQGTSIGSFTVVICSDMLEADLVFRLARERAPVDVMFVPSFNPYPELYEVLAQADAVRLHCAVVIANNYTDESNRSLASPEGSGIYVPARNAKERSLNPSQEIRFAKTDLFPGEGGLKLFDLDSETVNRSRPKPPRDILPVPHVRHGT